MKFLKLVLRSKKGQTATEYLLMLAVSVSIGITAFNKLKEYFLTSPNSIIGKPLNEMKQRLQQSPRYERVPFTIKKSM